MNQLDKFSADWKLIETELFQVGNIFDDSVDTNLEQCRMNCEHNVKLFSYDQVKKAKSIKALGTIIIIIIIINIIIIIRIETA